MHFRSVFRTVFCWALVTACSWVAAQATNAGAAYVADTADGGGPGGGAFFMVEAVDGTKVSETALSASARASAGRGAYMVVQGAGREVPAGQVTLRLRGIQTHVAPIDSLFRALFRGGNPEVAGNVTLQLAAGQRYRVNGVLDAFRREVWVEDERGAVVPDSKLALAPDPELVRQMEGALYTAHNLRYEGDWINEASWPSQAFVPAGSRLKVLDYGSHKASVLIDGRKMRMGIDWARGKETIQQFVARATSTEDPRPKIAAYPERVHNAVRSGRVFAGMTKEQVLLSMGRPRLDFVPTLDQSEWKYEVPEYEELFLVFDEAGVLKEVDGSRKARKLVLYDAP